MQLIQSWPDTLRAEHDELSGAAWRQFQAGDYEAAETGFRRAYELVLAAQPQGQRYHKGEALHNLGIALAWAGRSNEGLRETLAAFIEDAASLAEEQPNLLELDRPAAHNLVYVFGLAGPPLAIFARQVRALVISGRLLPDPHSILASPAATEAATPPAGTNPPRLVGHFTQPPERRVFIGGWYGRLEGTLQPLQDHLGELGYDAVVAADFGIPAGWGEDEIELSLLTNCHYAIFEISESAGQVEEIADVPETMRTPKRIFAAYDINHAPKPGISRGQTLVKLDRWKVEPVGYSDLEDLKRAAETWLASS